MTIAIHKALDNFYCRNLFLVFILASVHVGSRSTSSSFNKADFLIAFIFAAWSYIFYMFHNMVIYENLLKRRKYLLYALCFIIILILHRQGVNVLTGYFQKLWIRMTQRGWIALHWLDTMYFMLALGVYLAFKYAKDRERLLLVENEKKELELKQLSQQLNPHFLFNALNNIYSYLLTNKANGKELILKLSELMRYILDSNKRERVALKEEIQFIEHYLAFSKERLGNRCDIQYCKIDNSNNAQIVPLILFTFIENAFKHGTKDIEQAIIKIDLQVDDSRLILQVANPVSLANESSTKIGLANTHRRLDLLYAHNYELKTSVFEGIYTVVFKLNKLS